MTTSKFNSLYFDLEGRCATSSQARSITAGIFLDQRDNNNGFVRFRTQAKLASTGLAALCRGQHRRKRGIGKPLQENGPSAGCRGGPARFQNAAKAAESPAHPVQPIQDHERRPRHDESGERRVPSFLHP
jgi:hypothetical protein